MGGRGEVVVLSRIEPKMQFPHTRLSRFRLRPNYNPVWGKKRAKTTIDKKKARDPSPTEMSVEPWASPQDQAAAEDDHSTPSPPSQDQEQQQPDKLCLESFWSEVETIRQGCGDTDLDSTRRDSRQSEGNHCDSGD
ncbi:hypothetical protein CHARACLAT_027596 [Characodon lateralis]|uniref:Uncharacterized protein n=1 Tax=Characodon lateralis TaxID=208331 RepID=A0ABU7F6L5_9TELE|nr:hypothetical protein [Characodon lateralis]